MNKYVLIDGNAIGYQAFHAAKKSVVATPEEVKRAAVLAVNLTGRTVRNIEDRQALVLWDDKSQARLDICPVYKEQRRDTEVKVEDKRLYAEAREYTQKMYEFLGVRQLTIEGLEADDLAAYYSNALANKGAEIVLVTTDSDWWQLIRKGVELKNPRTSKFCTIELFEEITGFKNPRQFLEFKFLVGDVSDNIPGIGGFGQEKAKALLEEYGSLVEFLKKTSVDSKSRFRNDFIKLFNNSPSPKWSKILDKKIGMVDALWLNEDLMDLSRVVKEHPDIFAKRKKRFINHPSNLSLFESYVVENDLFISEGNAKEYFFAITANFNIKHFGEHK